MSLFTNRQAERKSIKNTITADEARRKREEKQNGLRKQKKDLLLQKRRKEGVSGATVHDPQVMEKVFFLNYYS